MNGKTFLARWRQNTEEIANSKGIAGDLKIGGTRSDVLGRIRGVVKNGDGHVFEDRAGEVPNGILDRLPGSGFEFVFDPAVTRFPLLNRLLGSDAAQSEFAIAKQRHVALVAKKGNEDHDRHDEEQKKSGQKNGKSGHRMWDIW